MTYSLVSRRTPRAAAIAAITLLATLAAATSAAHAATITVTNGNDAGAGSLRAALGGAGNGDTINFDPSVTEVVLTSAQLTVTAGVTISGPGADVLTVKRSTAGGTPDFRVFSIAPGAGNSATLSGITISNGKATPGGGISFTGGAGTQLNLVRIAVVGNDASWGGGLDLTGSQASSVLIDSSTISGNTTNGGFSCSFCNGAGMKLEVPTTIVNSTISGNTAGDNGGGMKVDSLVTILNSTIAGNAAGAKGGGIWETRFLNNPNLAMKNTLVADNTFGTGHHECDVDASNTTLSVNLNNLIEDGSCNFLWASGAVSGSATGFLSGDPGLSPLAYNGGTTKTQALAAGSIARGAGDATTCAASPVGGVDQRGVTRPSPCSRGAFDGTAVAPTPPSTPPSDPPADSAPVTDPVSEPEVRPIPSNSFRLGAGGSGGVSSQAIRTRVTVPGPGQITQRAARRAGSSSASAAAATMCSASRSASRAGTYTVTCKLNSAARRAQRRGAVRVTLRTTYTPTGGTARTVSRTITLPARKASFTG